MVGERGHTEAFDKGWGAVLPSWSATGGWRPDPLSASLEEVIVVKGVSPPIEPTMGSWGSEGGIALLPE